MQSKYVNAFCYDGEGVIEQNARAGVKSLRLLTDNPLEAQKKMQALGMSGVIVIKKELLGKKLNLSFPVAVWVDILECDEKTLEQISLSKLPVVIPLFDNLVRTGQISAMYDCSPAKLLEDMGFLDRDCTIVGGAYADKDDLDILGSYGCRVVVCPRAYAKKGSLMPNVVLMKKHALKVSVGTLDYEQIDMEREVEMLYLSTLSMLENPNAVTKKEIENLATGELQ